MNSRAALLPIAVGLVQVLNATSWQVGPGQTYTAPSQVSTLVGNGDTVNIEAGVYPSDVARWQADDLVLRGVGGMAHLESNGNAWGGKAIWVIEGDRTTVEWIEFSECAVPDENGAGIRQEGSGLTVRRCSFHHNENGILAGTVNPSTIRIEHCEFAYNGFGDGQSHNLYINNIDSLIFRFNYSHHAHIGHELKSRAQVNVIEYNRFSNEADGDASREIDLPNGGTTYLIGNAIQQGPQGENSNLVGFGLEGLSNPGPHELYAVNNTLVNEKSVGSFFQMPGTVYFKAFNNILAGGGSFVTAWPATIDTLANLRRTDISSCGFITPSNYDYRIDTDSPAHNLGIPAGLANSGYPLVALWEYVHPVEGILRCQHALLDAGAFETCTTGINENGSSGLLLFPNPAHEQLSIRSTAAMSSVELIDAQGRIVRQIMTNTGEGFVVEIRGLAPGHFTARVSTAGGVWQRGFVKLP
jgi:hypothetical protein